jgi:hypothetical protein
MLTYEIFPVIMKFQHFYTETSRTSYNHGKIIVRTQIQVLGSENVDSPHSRQIRRNNKKPWKLLKLEYPVLGTV